MLNFQDIRYGIIRRSIQSGFHVKTDRQVKLINHSEADENGFLVIKLLICKFVAKF